MIKNAVLFSIACLLAASAAAADSSPAVIDRKTELVMQVMEVTRMDEMMGSMQEQMRELFESQLKAEATCAAVEPVVREFSQELSAAMGALFEGATFKADIGSLYAEVFSEEELGEIVAFYRSPLGQKLLARMPELMQKSMQVTQTTMQAITPELERIAKGYAERIREAEASCPAGDDDAPAAD